MKIYCFVVNQYKVGFGTITNDFGFNNILVCRVCVSASYI